MSNHSPLTTQNLTDVSPALADYARRVLADDLWQRSELSARDRSVITVAALCARGASPALAHHLDQAVENGVTPGELSEIVTHLAFYVGWGEMSAVIPLLKQMFDHHGVTPEALPEAHSDLLPLDEEAEAKRAATVAKNVEPTAPNLAHDTGEVLFKDLWLRPGLAPRDRSLATVAALIATGQPGQITFHLNKAMDNGLSAPEASEILGHLAYYAGWPKAMSAVGVFKEVLAQRGD